MRFEAGVCAAPPAPRGYGSPVTSEQREAIEQLTAREAAKRESAANKLSRKPCPAEAGPAILQALQAELEDSRTWKAKAAQASALARNPHPSALDFLLGIAGDDLGGSAVNDNVGSAAMASGLDDPGPDYVLRALLGKGRGEVPTDRLAAVVGALAILAHPPALDETLVGCLLAIAEEDPPETIPHGKHRRLRVFQLRHALLGIAGGLSSDHRGRLLEVAERTDFDPKWDTGWEKSLSAARQLD